MSKAKALHVAIIPDGNRRWAKAQRLTPWKGHERSARNFREIIEWCCKHPRIGTLTIWCFSTENWKRDEAEVRKLMGMLERYLTKEEESFRRNKIRLLHSGRADRFTPKLRRLLERLQEETAGNDAFTLHLAIDYGGKDELIRAIGRMPDAAKVTEKTFRSFLDQPELPEMDLVIRTSGEMRTSNFFLWQSAYAEWIFEEKLFPDFGTEDFERCLAEFDRRARRFGS